MRLRPRLVVHVSVGIGLDLDEPAVESSRLPLDASGVPLVLRWSPRKEIKLLTRRRLSSSSEPMLQASKARHSLISTSLAATFCAFF
jgi:hypothetical protein